MVFLDSFQFMSLSLDKLVEIIKKCGKCETCKPDGCIKRYINNKGHIIQHKTSFRCRQCRNIKNVWKNCANPVNNKLKYTFEVFTNNKLNFISKKVYILMTSWIVSKNLNKQNYQQKKIFIVFWMTNRHKKIINMLKIYGILFTSNQWMNTMT